jgi:hypothetical protein
MAGGTDEDMLSGHIVPSGCTGCCGIQPCGIQADHFLKENNVKLTLVLWSGPAGLWQLAAALWRESHEVFT